VCASISDRAGVEKQQGIGQMHVLS